MSDQRTNETASGPVSDLTGQLGSEVCKYCYKPAIKFRQTLARWFESGEDCVAHAECYDAAKYKCPRCGNDYSIKIPNGLPIYCEDCNWPDEEQ